MPERLYFDCNAAVGSFPRKHARARWSQQHVLEDLELAGIAGALVYHQQAMHYDPMKGNLRLIDEISGHRGTLFPCWLAMPNFSGEFPDVPEFMRLLAEHDVRAVRIELDRFGVPVKEHLWSALRDALREAGVLCVVPALGGLTESLEQLLHIFQDNETLLVDLHWWGHWKKLIDVMETFPRLHTEFSAFQSNRAVEYFAGRFGADRCLFGTGLPDKAPGAARGFLDWTLLPEADAALIAGGNLRRLLGAGPAPTTATAWRDSLTAAAMAGQPLPCTVLDAHCHMLHDGGSAAGGGLVFHRGDAAGMIELTRRTGIDQTAIMSWAGPLSLDTDTGNEVVANAVRQFPDELIGLATINPDYDDEAKIEEVIQHYHVELRFPGLKTFTPCQSVDYDDPKFHLWYQYANDNNLYAVIDPKGGVAAGPCMRHLATRYPRMGIHLDHCGQSWEYAEWAVALMKEFPNIWAQLNYTSVTNGVIEYLASEVGAGRMLFGTDAPMRDPRPQAGWLTFTRLTEPEKRLIFGENFARILAGTFCDAQPLGPPDLQG